MWMALGRLGLRTGRLEEARQSLERGLQIHDKSGDTGGQCVAKLALAEVLRAEEALDEAQALLDEALAKAQLIRSGQLEGRAQSRRAALLLQRGRVEEAGKAWSLALDCLRASGDTEMEGYALVGLGEVRSSLGRSDAMSNLAEGARVLGALEHQHGLGVAMTHVAQHGLRLDKPGLAAAAAESARQLLQRSDPVRGGGRALRLLVKALAALEEWPAVNVVAQLRAQVAGTVQPNAIAVRDFYLARSPQDSREDLEGMSDDQLEVRAETLLEPILNPLLLPLDLDPFALGTPGGALALVAALVEVAPAAGASIAEPETVTFESDEPLQAPTHGEFTSLYSLPGPEMPIPADADGVESRD